MNLKVYAMTDVVALKHCTRLWNFRIIHEYSQSNPDVSSHWALAFLPRCTTCFFSASLKHVPRSMRLGRKRSFTTVVIIVLDVSKTFIFDIATLSFRGNLKNALLSIWNRIVLVWADSRYIPSILQQALDNDVLGPQFL